MEKIVLYPITVPKSNYCWEFTTPYSICEHFDNEGGYPTCDLGFLYLTNTDAGITKPDKCLKLKENK